MSRTDRLSDIRGFTPISEQLTAGSMVNLLNRYFDAVTKSIRDTNGIVDKYIGDAVMAFWAPPFSPGDTHAAACCSSALAQQRQSKTSGATSRSSPDYDATRRNYSFEWVSRPVRW